MPNFYQIWLTYKDLKALTLLTCIFDKKLLWSLCATYEIKHAFFMLVFYLYHLRINQQADTRIQVQTLVSHEMRLCLQLDK